MKTGGDLLRFGCVGEQVTCNLFDRKLVERHVVVESPDHPVPISPMITKIVALKAMRIGIASQVEPVSCPLFSELRALQEDC